jgi:hypothetical protein
MSRSGVIDTYFMEHRAKVLDIAAFLDRLDRAPNDSPDKSEDFRIHAMRNALGILIDGQPQRAKRVLELFSDPTLEPIDKAPMKGALGAYSGTNAMRK